LKYYKTKYFKREGEKMTRVLLYTVLMLFVSQISVAQKEANNWHFGYRAGWTWNATRDFDATGLFGTANARLSGLPTLIDDTKIYTAEGCFSISDVHGNLIAYSDGISVWNKSNAVINGTPMTGDSSSPQSGIVFPYPGDVNKYVVVTQNATDKNKLAYSILNKTGTMGSLNTPFQGYTGYTGESVYAVRHQNGIDYWVVAPSMKTLFGPSTPSYLNTWLVTSAGVQSSAPKETIELPKTLNAYYSHGYLKISRNGKNFAFATWMDRENQGVFIGNFDDSTGKFSNIKFITLEYPYGIEFSRSGKYLYVMRMDEVADSSPERYFDLLVYDFKELLSAADPDLVVPITYGEPDATTRSTFGGTGAIQMGPDNRIYITNLFLNNAAYKNVIVITNPEEYDKLKIYRLPNFISNNGRPVAGLPNFVSFGLSQLDGPDSFCLDGVQQTFTLNITKGTGTTELSHTEWDFGDESPIETVNTFSMDKQVKSHIYKKTGTYYITVKAFLKSDGLELEDLRETMEVTVNPCVIVVNPNIHLYE